MDSPKKILSIIIPTYNRPQGLVKVLNSIKAQNVVLDDVEIIVVNNYMDAAKETGDIIEMFSAGGFPVRLFDQPLVGGSQARNLGISQSRGRWLAFIDDDEELIDGYLHEVLHILNQAEENWIVGGPYIPRFDCEQPSWVKEQYYSVSFGREAKDLQGNEYLPGGNMIITKSMLEKIGGFLTRLGHFGNKPGYGEDTELMIRAVNAGGIQKYVPEMAVYHHIPASRLSLNWLIKQKRLSSLSKAYLYSLYQSSRPKGAKRSLLIFYYLRQSVYSFGKYVFSILGEPLRDRKLFPYRENYWIERVSPFFAKYQINLELAKLVFRRSDYA
jgi:glycosyltransferase involved in cell wall biosynthesis